MIGMLSVSQPNLAVLHFMTRIAHSTICHKLVSDGILN